MNTKHYLTLVNQSLKRLEPELKKIVESYHIISKEIGVLKTVKELLENEEVKTHAI